MKGYPLPLLLASFGLVAGQLMATPFTLELKPQTQKNAGEIYLKDLVLTDDVNLPFLNLSIGSAPSLGRERVLTRETLSNLIKSRWPRHEIQWRGSPLCIIQSPARYFSSSELKQLLVTELQKLTGGLGKVEIQDVPGLESFLVPDGEFQSQLEFAPSTLMNSWTTALLRCLVEGDTVLSKSIKFRWSWYRPVWQALSPLAIGTPLQIHQFQQVSMDSLALPPESYEGPELPQEMYLTQSIPTGGILTRRHYKPIRLVHRGDMVTLIYNHSGVQITLKAHALEDGSRGETILVQNPSSRKQISAKVVDSSKVQYLP